MSLINQMLHLNLSKIITNRQMDRITIASMRLALRAVVRKNTELLVYYIPGVGFDKCI